MQKFPLTAVGFESLQTQLYRLSNAELEAQAIKITTDFILWMDQNFELNKQQMDHLRSLSPSNIAELSSQTAIAVQGRLKISLIKQEVKPINSYDSKYIKTATSVQVLASDDDDFEAEGELVIQIGY